MVIVGFGTYKGFQIQEVPADFLDHLAKCYPLSHSSHCDSGASALRATIAVHEGIQRRAAGGLVVRRQMSHREMALKLIAAGFRQISRQLHPDMPGGELEAQKSLGAVRDDLVELVRQIQEPVFPDALIIEDPESSNGWEITDDDIPF